jgi:para-nitrobenzyl esterase
MPNTVAIGDGALQGVEGDEYVKFLGIPYAAPPTGDLRWRAPQPVEPWSGVRDASRFGPSCIQPSFPTSVAVLDPGVQSEDCLYLNVWAPKNAGGRKLPVMMWIHGGSYILGSGSWRMFDGAALARQDVVYVSINYRLNYFGFFAHPALTDENADGLLGNYGILDQIAALKWIQRNIAAFGGDPDNVTVFGESAGGTFTNLLMISPLSKGLFHRAIVQSAPTFQRWPRLQRSEGLSKPEAAGQKHAARIGAGDDLRALRAVPAEQVLGDPSRVIAAGLGPIIDGKILVEREAEAYEAGLQHRLPLMIGATDFEASLMAAYPMPANALVASLGPDTARTLAVYDPEGIRTDEQVANDIFGDRQFVAPARYIAKLAANHQPVYHYHFSYVPESLRGAVQGAEHGSDVGFVFDAGGAAALHPFVDTDETRAMAKAMTTYWTNFARTGDPNGTGLPEWPRCPADIDVTMEFGANGPSAVRGLLAERLDYVEPFARARPLT